MFRVALASLVLFAPPQPASPDSSGVDPSSAEQLEYSLEAAQADIEVILVDRGRAYLDARARLEANPDFAAEAVMARLQAVPAPGPEKRDRLLNVLATCAKEEHVGMFATQLREAMIRERPTELWFSLLRRQGEAATGPLIELVGDKELSNEQRSELLELLIELSDRKRLGELMIMVGRGSDELQDTLRRAVIRRARASVADRELIAKGIDEGLDEGPDAAAQDAGRTAQLLILRAACCGLDEDFVARLEQFAADTEGSFPVRVAAIDGLARLERGAEVLEAIARAGGSEALAGSQAAEILVALTIDALGQPRAAVLVQELGLLGAAAPRLASLAYTHAELSTDHSWLSASQTHAWPEVRKRALERVAEANNCSKDTLRELATITGPVSEGGDSDARVGRSAVGALGRCGDEPAFKLLREVLEDTGVDLTQRAAAARELSAHDPSGADHVAKLLLSGRYPDLARELASALSQAEAPSELVRDALCRTAQANPMVASTARGSLSKLFPGQDCSE